MEEERRDILNKNLGQLLLKFSYPAITALVFGALYNMVDTIFIGKSVGPVGIAALTIVLPVMMVMWAIGFMVGAGASSIISRNLGAGNRRVAVRTGANAIILNTVIGLAFMIPCYLFLERLLKFFGASDNVLPYAMDYASIVLIGFILYSFDAFARMAIKAEGKPRASMYPTVFGAVLNIILDAVFVIVLKMGIRGAAIATVISQALTLAYILLFFRFGKSIYKFTFSDFKINWKLIWETLKIGISSFLMVAIDGFIILVFNRVIMKYGNDVYIAIVGIVIRFIDLTVMPIIGITQGFSTIVGFNYGAKQYERVKRILANTIIWNTVYSFIIFIIMMAFPSQLISIFSGDPEFIRLGITPFRILIILYPLWSLQLLGGTFFQAIGKALPATIITLSRQLLFLLPAVFFFPMVWGLKGLWFTWPFSDFMYVIVFIIFITWELRIINRMIKKNILESDLEIAGDLLKS